MTDEKETKNKEYDEYVGGDYFEEKEEKSFKQRLEDFLDSKYFLVSVFILVSIISFSLGRISESNKKEAVRVIKNGQKIEQNIAPSNTTEVSKSNTANLINSESQNLPEVVVGSKNGTKYHYPWCPGAKQISEKNLITFNSIEEARAKGYTNASNCKGLK